MATEIINNGASLKIVVNGTARYILKNQIKTIDIVKTNIIKLDIGQGINNIFITSTDVDNPTAATPDALRDAINAMLASTAAPGDATEADQSTQIGQLTAIKTDLDTILTKISNLNDKAFYSPLLVDEGTPNTVFRGYAATGAAVTDPVWAVSKTTINGDVTTIQWAGGTQAMSNVWNNRATLTYS